MITCSRVSSKKFYDHPLPIFFFQTRSSRHLKRKEVGLWIDCQTESDNHVDFEVDFGYASRSSRHPGL